MILINLLPHREEKRRLRKQAFFVGLGLSVVAGAAVVALWFAVQMQMISSQEKRNNTLKAAIAKLDEEIKDVSALKAEIDALKARQRAVEDLQTDRNMPVYLLNELVAHTPEGVFLTSIRQTEKSVLVTGQAQTNERVSEFLRATNTRSQWLEHPELVEIKAANAKDARDNKRLFDFSVRLGLKRPGEVSAAASGASAAEASASAAGAASGAAPSGIAGISRVAPSGGQAPGPATKP